MSHSATSAAAAKAAVHDHKDYEGAKMGMWIFLFTEVLLFGGLFILYAVYRTMYPGAFHEASSHLDVLFGTVNTIVLLTSSLTMALSIAAFQRGQKSFCMVLLAITLLCGLIFMVNKYFEWTHKFHLGIFPGSERMFMMNEAGEPAMEKGKIVFYNLYYLMTGLHGLHVVIGMAVIAGVGYVMLGRPNYKKGFEPFLADEFQGAKVVIKSKDGEELWESPEIDDSVKLVNVQMKHFARKERIKGDDYVALENAGLYWHLVDVIWIFLFPLFYLIS